MICAINGSVDGSGVGNRAGANRGDKSRPWMSNGSAVSLSSGFKPNYGTSSDARGLGRTEEVLYGTTKGDIRSSCAAQ